MSVIETIRNEQQLAAAVLASLNDTLGDDEEAIHDTVEGETGLLEAIDAALDRLLEIDALREAIAEQAKKLKARSERLDRQKESIRAAITNAMEVAGLKRLERPRATISRRRIAPTAVITDETLLPASFFSEPKPPEPKPDKRLILAAIKGGMNVPGAQLSNGSETVAITVT